MSYRNYQCCVNFRAGYGIFDVKIPDGRIDGLYVGNMFFNMQKIVTSQLKNAEKAALFVCTIGLQMEAWSRRLFREGDAVTGHIVDTIASIAVENAASLLHDHIQMKIQEKGLKITNRFSPGYCGWPVSEQHLLFSLLPEGFCGITLTESSLMMPMKSISGIIGIGAKVNRKAYLCDQCMKKECMFRNYIKVKKRT